MTDGFALKTWVINLVNKALKKNGLRYNGVPVKLSVSNVETIEDEYSVIPSMTSNTMDFGTVVASSEYSNGGYPPYKAFNSDNRGWYPIAPGAKDQYVEFRSIGIIAFNMIAAECFIDDLDNQYTISISNDGIKYTDIGTFTFGKRKFIKSKLDKEYSAKYIRFNIQPAGGYGEGVKFKLFTTSSPKQYIIKNAEAVFYEDDQ